MACTTLGRGQSWTRFRIKVLMGQSHGNPSKLVKLYMALIGPDGERHQTIMRMPKAEAWTLAVCHARCVGDWPLETYPKKLDFWRKRMGPFTADDDAWYDQHKAAVRRHARQLRNTIFDNPEIRRVYAETLKDYRKKARQYRLNGEL